MRALKTTAPLLLLAVAQLATPNDGAIDPAAKPTPLPAGACRTAFDASTAAKDSILAQLPSTPQATPLPVAGGIGEFRRTGGEGRPSSVPSPFPNNARHAAIERSEPRARANAKLKKSLNPTPTDTPPKAVTLANRWRLTPAGTAIPLPGDMPGTIIPLPDGKHALVNTCGFHNHSLSLLNLNTKQIESTLDLEHDWVGMSMGADGTVYVSGGSSKGGNRIQPTKYKGVTPSVRLFSIAGNQIKEKGSYTIMNDEVGKNFTSGVVALKDGSLMVLDIQTDTAYKLNAATGDVIAQRTVGYRPYAVAESPDGSKLAISNWGDQTVSILSSKDLTPIATVPTSDRPNALKYGPDGRLFVACAGANTVAVIRNNKVVENIRTSLDPRDLIGAAPVALAISNDERKLFVANADNNDVAMIDISKYGESEVLGFIPTARYPSALALTNDGKHLLIGVAKGFHDGPNIDPTNLTPWPTQKKSYRSTDKGIKYNYIPSLLQGSVSVVTVPGPKQLARYTAQSISNRPNDATPKLTKQDRSARIAALKKIHHVVYIIRENRTYDQVLGDVSKGNGEKKLVMFGQDITPNSHALVNKFSLLDNLFCDGEVSQIGHQWTDAGYAGDYTQKAWVLSYSGREEIESDPRLTSAPGGFIWQDAQRHHKTTRIYGEYIQWQEDHSSATGDVAKNPEKYGCSAAFEKVFHRDGRDTEKADVFLDELHAAEKKGKWPNFMVMALNEDHTKGLSAGAHTPQACVASNDLALGRVVDGITHSRFWKDTAIFIIQDDAQDGPDHVDAHRTVGLFLSPYVRRGIVDSTHYTTTSMLHTMELILGLPPMNQYDRAATPMLASVTTKPDFSPFTFLPETYDLNLRNPDHTSLAARSAKLDFSDIDRADPDELNAILWEAIKGRQPMPAPVHGRVVP